MNYSRPGWSELGRRVYDILSGAVFGAALPWLAVKYRDGFSERMGRYTGGGTEGMHPLWVHAVSVGEVQAAWPLVREARRSGWKSPVFMTTITRTGRKMAENLVGIDADQMAYYPWDAPWIARRAIDRVLPAAFVTVETEIWPNFVMELARREIPAFIANGRFSERSFRKAIRFKEFWREVMSTFRLILVRGEEDASRLLDLGLEPERVVVDGDCKVDALLLRREDTDRDALRAAIGSAGARLLIAGSTHTGEDIAVLEAFREVRARFSGVKMVIAPRHPERSPEVASMASSFGSVSMFSKPREGWDILVVDEVGQLFGLYGISDSAFVGGSLVPRGGQNILEPAAWGVPVRHGPHMEDFRPHSETLISLGAAAVARSASELAKLWEQDLSGSTGKGISGKGYVEGLGGAAALSWERISSILKAGE
ncbi:MAG: glycosyltransferase N-terminal domain-containing protein [Thermovirgaceae bacterium]|jgi:3-deoxy-D-manno-octulosonic-acid transferase|nr:glycosyltransferase N-terminal domain-containing protein [Synergistales bacterium]MDD5515280.1 glycosyltransferase N-terminal domain-containing protein [Synergistales bacterium]MDI9392681.1 glycosyltransferase N-terminal domain-containing protein [Synergistota bacterium]NLV65488.1 3-deoxy-D-manno-octulosonic acid transferase [Synergistaceae bacterium]